MPHTVLLRLVDMAEAIQGIQKITAGVSFGAFAQNWAMQRATERGLEIISEASRHIPDSLKALAPDIPWRQIAAIGNILRHEYQRTDPRITWNIVEQHFSQLEKAVEFLLEEARKMEG